MIENKSYAPLICENKSQYTFHVHADIIVLEPHAMTELKVKTHNKLEEFDLKFVVLNAVTAPNTHPEITAKTLIYQE